MNRHRCECSICTGRGAEIERLQEAKRAALKLADERGKEAGGLRQALVEIGRGCVDPCSVARNALAAVEGLAR